MFAATLEAISAKTAAFDHALRTHAWFVLAVAVAAFLPSVLCGFAGGVIGSTLATPKQGQKPPSSPVFVSPWLKWFQLGIAAVAFAGIASPICLLVKAPVVDPLAPVVVPPPQPPPFHYEPPAGIVSAKIGEIQPDFIKTISEVQSSCPMAMSPDGVLIAFGDSSGPGSAIAVYDLHRFTKIASMDVPAYPDGSLAWSPDQKSVACVIGEEKKMPGIQCNICDTLLVPFPP